MRSLLAFCLLWAFAGNGGSIAFCPPPCEGAVPFGEIAHLGALISGGLASYATWRAAKAIRQRSGWAMPFINVLLVAATFVALALATE